MKKVKLFTTIASLCLAVALMAFGVYAATNVKFTISNNVSYTAAEYIKAKIEFSTATENCTAANVNTTTTIWSDEDGNAEDVDAGTFDIGSVVLTSTSNDLTELMTYSYTVTVTNLHAASDANSTVYVDAEYPQEVDNLDTLGYKIEVDELSAATVTTAAKTTSYTVKITVKQTSTITEIDLGSSIELLDAAKA